MGLLTVDFRSGMCARPPIDCARAKPKRKNLVQVSLPRPPRRDHPQALVRPWRNHAGLGPQERFLFQSQADHARPRRRRASGRTVLRGAKDDNLDYVGGLEMGAVPLAGALAQLSWIKGHPIAAFFVRKKP